VKTLLTTEIIDRDNAPWPFKALTVRTKSYFSQAGASFVFLSMKTIICARNLILFAAQ